MAYRPESGRSGHKSGHTRCEAGPRDHFGVNVDHGSEVMTRMAWFSQSAKPGTRANCHRPRPNPGALSVAFFPSPEGALPRPGPVPRRPATGSKGGCDRDVRTGGGSRRIAISNRGDPNARALCCGSTPTEPPSEQIPPTKSKHRPSPNAQGGDHQPFVRSFVQAQKAELGLSAGLSGERPSSTGRAL